MSIDLKANIMRTLLGKVEPALIIVRKYSPTAKAITGMKDSDVMAAANAVLKPPYLAPMPGPGYKDLAMQVQFNPSKLQISATSRALFKTNMQKPKTGQPPGGGVSTPQPATMQLSFKLIFDQMNTTDSFMFDKFNTLLSPAGALKAIGSIFAPTYTVQPVVEAFIAMLRDPLTRHVGFVWKDFSFAGFLLYTNVEYTMFSPGGHPVRAEVGVTLRHEGDLSSYSQFTADYEKAFTGVNSQLSSKASSFENVLNLGI